jgi:hypothetical protein
MIEVEMPVGLFTSYNVSASADFVEGTASSATLICLVPIKSGFPAFWKLEGWNLVGSAARF